MRRHIFTLGIILSCIYGINAMAWPTVTATDVWTNSGHTTLATKRCSDCCKTDCWLPSGTYYDTKGTFTETCTGEPSEPTCGVNRPYSMVNGICTAGSCPSGTYDIGFSSCISAGTNGSDDGYWDFDEGARNTYTYGLTAGGQWGVTFSYGKIKGIASCNSTEGEYCAVTDTEFSNTVTGRYCWCKITSPSASRWVCRYSYYDDADDCASSCAQNCAVIRNNFPFRSSMLGTVGN